MNHLSQDNRESQEEYLRDRIDALQRRVKELEEFAAHETERADGHFETIERLIHNAECAAELHGGFCGKCGRFGKATSTTDVPDAIKRHSTERER